VPRSTSSRRRRAATVLAAAAITLLLAYAALTRGFVRFVYPGAGEYPVRGIDVSHHNGRVDWPRVRAAGYIFAYLKATEGVTFRDSTFARNRAEAQAAGMVTGAYHYFTLCRPGDAQARGFVAATGPREAVSLPPAVDLEFGGNCDARPPRDSVLAELGRFLAIVDSAQGRPTVLYVTAEFHDAYLAGAVDHPLWVRSVFHAPRFAEPWLFWQYAATGRIDGVRGRVDLDAFNGSPEAFRRLTGESPSPRTP
jgi:lysozyme